MKEDQIIDILEPGAQLTEEQLQEIAHDDALREDCEDLFMTVHQMSIKEGKGDINVEQELESFHSRMDRKESLKDEKTIKPTTKAKIRPLTLFKYAVAAAAIFIGIFIVTRKEKSDESIILANDTTQQQIRIETKNGKAVPVKTVLSDNHIDKKLVVLSTAQEETYAISVPYGQSLEVCLPDSSQVFLHPGSVLEYSSTFNKDKREVQLKGEAYFVVTKDEKRPFIVRTDRSQTIVYGTEFNVCSVNGSTEKITLIKGSVGIRSKEDRHPIQITPGQQAAFCSDGIIRLSQVNTEPFISWRDGYFYFDNEQLRDILISLGKYYNKSIECHYPELLTFHMRFIIPRNKDINYVVEMINRMDKVHAEIQGNTILVEP